MLDIIPAEVLIAAVLFKNETIAVIELSSLVKFSERQIDFVEKIKETVGIIIQTQIANIKIKKLLD